MLRRWLITSALSTACILSLFFISATRADAAVITGGCASTNVSCTMPELTSGAFFAVNSNLFANFSVEAGPQSASVVVSPICPGCGDFSGARLVPGFIIDFGQTFTDTTKGARLTFVLDYDFFPSLATFGATSVFLLPGTVNGRGDTVGINVQSSGFPGPDINLNCPALGCPSNTIFGTTQSFFDPTSTHFHLVDSITVEIGNDTGGTPLVEINAFTQTFRAIPEPGTIALFATSLLGLGWLARRRRA